jgi:hypothetical protein
MRPAPVFWGILFQAFLAIGVFAQAPTIPPVITTVSPPGVKRGTVMTITIQGRNLRGANSVIFDTSGITGKIVDVKDLPEGKRVVRPGVDLGALLPQGIKQQAELELTLAADVPSGVHQFLIQTPLGTTNNAVLEVGALKEIPEVEPNDVESQKVELPATLMGTVGWPGDVDSYEFTGKAGQEMIFQIDASALGSELDSVLTLRDSSGKELARAGDVSRKPDALLIHKLPADGKYTITVSDLEKTGGPGYFYRLNAGPLPFITEVYPLGVRAGRPTEVEVRGANLGDIQKAMVQAPPHAEGWQTIPLRVKTNSGESLNEVKLVVGNEPEVPEMEPNNSPAEAQRVSLPVTINGRVSGKDGSADVDYFRFIARKGEHITVEVAASRLGSELDSVVDVLDAQGRPISQNIVRAIADTTLTLSDRDSRSRLFRLTSLAGFRPNDYLLIGDEVMQIDFVPDQPDADIRVKGIGDERIALLNTSRQAHTINDPVYKAQILPPGSKVPPIGLPALNLTLHNDDGGPGYETDSRLDFIAPQEAEYVLRLKDVRGLQGENFQYRLMIRESGQDFTLLALPANPNIPRGGRVPITVMANRILGYRGPIEIQVEGLPKGITSNPATIPADQDSTTVVLEASADVQEAQEAAPFQIVGRAKIEERDVIRRANPDQRLQLVAVMPPPDVLVTAQPQNIVLEPGKEAAITLHVERKNGFQGRIPFNVLNLPPGVTIVNSGLNGILVTENETDGTFRLRAESWAKSLEQPIYITATVESNSPTNHASSPLMLKVRSRELATASGVASTAKH